ncbi:EF-hand domain-containing protein [Luteimonas sp. WGS1318]|uniref:EF-hand domain-containing protein n=1 Tax=Luteimonas sp. WGS1318 TaxID=3366815 RepID=UPI00372D330D
MERGKPRQCRSIDPTSRPIADTDGPLHASGRDGMTPGAGNSDTTTRLCGRSGIANVSATPEAGRHPMKGLHVAALVPLLLFGDTPAQANPRGAAHVEAMFRDFDIDRDGVITQVEVRAAAAREFPRHDLDGDGLLSYAEISKQQLEAGASQLPPHIQAKVIEAAFVFFDFDGNRRITLENFQQSQIKLLLQADFNKDGQVTLREARQLHGLDTP